MTDIARCVHCGTMMTAPCDFQTSPVCAVCDDFEQLIQAGDACAAIVADESDGLPAGHKYRRMLANWDRLVLANWSNTVLRLSKRGGKRENG